jgi:hypothetical protein
MTDNHTKNMEAFNLFLRGRYSTFQATTKEQNTSVKAAGDSR